MWLDLGATIMGSKNLFRAGLDLDGGSGSSLKLSRGGLVQFLLNRGKALLERALEPKGDDATYLGNHLSGRSSVRAAFSKIAGS